MNHSLLPEEKQNFAFATREFDSHCHIMYRAIRQGYASKNTMNNFFYTKNIVIFISGEFCTLKENVYRNRGYNNNTFDFNSSKASESTVLCAQLSCTF